MTFVFIREVIASDLSITCPHKLNLQLLPSLT